MDNACGMQPGTFDALSQNNRVFLQNVSGFSPVKPSVIVNGEFSIICQDINSNDMITWVVFGERKDKFIMESEATDDNGHLILEVAKKHKDGREMTLEEVQAQMTTKDHEHNLSQEERNQRKTEYKVERGNRRAEQRVKQEQRKSAKL